MTFTSQDAEDIVHWAVLGLATVLERSDITDKQIKRLRAHDIFADLVKAMYNQRSTFVKEARVLFRVGPEQYLKRKAVK